MAPVSSYISLFILLFYPRVVELHFHGIIFGTSFFVQNPVLAPVSSYISRKWHPLFRTFPVFCGVLDQETFSGTTFFVHIPKMAPPVSYDLYFGTTRFVHYLFFQ